MFPPFLVQVNAQEKGVNEVREKFMQFFKSKGDGTRSVQALRIVCKSQKVCGEMKQEAKQDVGLLCYKNYSK